MGAFDEAIAFALDNESPWSRDPARGRWGTHFDDPAPSGAGTSIVWTDPARDAAVVLRWIDSSVAGAILSRFSAALSACAKDLGLGVKGVPGEPE